MRTLFGTDGVRGVAGVDLTADLARELGAAAAAWAGEDARVLIGRDTRESGPELDEAVAEGIVSAGGRAVHAGVIPTPGVAVLTRLGEADLGCVISASHNPYQDNGIKFLGGDGRNINAGVGSTHLEALGAAVRTAGAGCGLAFDGDADRCLAVDASGRPVNGDAIIAAIALARKVDRVVVTSMTNLGFHRVMRERGIAVEVTDVGDRYVLERMLATGATLGGEQSGHIVDLVHHTTGDGIATALMLLAALGALGMSMTDLADLVVPFPQRLVAVNADRAALGSAERVWKEVAAAEAKLGPDGRVVLRASGTEPVVRVMVEAENAAICDEVCEHLVQVVQTEIGVG